MTRRALLTGALAAASLPAPGRGAERLPFPAGFLWGTASSSYQVEGRGDRQADSIWDRFCRAPGMIRDGSNGDVACDQYHRYAEDIRLIAGAGLKAYRFSISWPRVLPEGTGSPDPRGLDYYSRLVDALLAANIEPWLCLFHWDLPQALQDRGGWGNRDIANWYAEYAALVAKRLGDRVNRWVTLNEPSVHAILGHGLGQHAPGLTGSGPTLAALHHQNLAHGSGVTALRAIGGTRFQIGTALSLQPSHPAIGNPANTEAAAMWDAVWNRASLDPLLRGNYPARLRELFGHLVKADDLARMHQPIDFVGVNYYSPAYLRSDPGHLFGVNWGAAPPGTPMTGMGWPIDPNGLIEVLADLRDHYGNPPVYITENGACFTDQPGTRGRVDDRQRTAYLHDHIAAAHRAIAQKANLRGYFAWTILDNFEWAEGYQARFGLVRVERSDLRRIPKASYDWLAEVARANAV